MSTYTVTGNDTLTLNGRVIIDNAYGTVSQVAFPNELVTIKTGKNGNTVLAQNASGFNATLTMRLTRGSSDDQFMQALVPAAGSSFPSTTLLAGTFVKNLGDGQGNVVSDTYALQGGIISKQVEGAENVEGDTEQGVAVYNVKFSNAARVIS